MCVCSRCHKATPRLVPACHANVPCHAAPCKAMQVCSRRITYSTNHLRHHLVLHLHRSLSPLTAFRCGCSRSRQDRRALAPPLDKYLIDASCISTPLFRAAPTTARATGMSASSVLVVRRVAWRGIGGAVGRGGESSCFVALHAWGLDTEGGVSGSACLTGRRATSLPSRWAGK